MVVADDDPESIQKVANAFVQHFYYEFLYSFEKIDRFYKDGRMIFRPQYGHFLQNFTIKEMEGIMSPQKYSDVKIEPEDICAHSFKLGVEILVEVDGQLIGKDKTVQCFSQTFLLEQHKGKKGVYSAVYDEFKYTHGKNEESVSDVDVDDDDGDDHDHEFVYPGGFCYRNYYTAEMAGQLLLPKQSTVFQYLESIGDDDREDVDADGYRDFHIWNQSDFGNQSDVLMDEELDFATIKRIFEFAAGSSVFDTDEADLRDPRDGSVIDAESEPEPELGLFVAGGKAAASTFIPFPKKSERENAEKKGSPKRSLDEDESDEESQNILGKESLQAGDGITSASDSISFKWGTENVSARYNSKSKKKSIKGSPRNPGKVDEIGNERCDGPRKELSEAGARPTYASALNGLLDPGSEKTKTLIIQYGENKGIVSDGGDPRDGSVINPEPASVNFEWSPKSSRDEDEYGKESQNILGKELSEAGARQTYAAALNELPHPGSQKTKTLKENQKLNPKVTGGSGNQSQNTLPKGHTLDLHGQDRHEAEHSVIDKLLQFSSPDRNVTVTMIPGRGEHSVGKPVINDLLLDLLSRLDLDYKLYNKGGAVDITIEKGWSGSLRSGNVQKSGQIFDFSVYSFELKDASSSNAQVSRSAGEYVNITANDNDGYEVIIKDFKRRIIDMKNDMISLPIDGNIFQQEKVDFFSVFREDLIDFSDMKKVDVTLISADMRLLFAKYKKSCKNITFLDPACTSTNLSLGISEGLKKEKKNQLLFIPYNIQSMAHWVLMVIVCSTMTVYWVDSLHTKPDAMIEVHVKTGLNPLFTPNTERPIWEIIKGPKQPPDSVQCGYFVMKFMRDLIFTDEPSQSQSIEMKMEKLAGKVTYTLEEINLVRAEFSNYITVLEKIYIQCSGSTDS